MRTLGVGLHPTWRRDGLLGRRAGCAGLRAGRRSRSGTQWRSHEARPARHDGIQQRGAHIRPLAIQCAAGPRSAADEGRLLRKRVADGDVSYAFVTPASPIPEPGGGASDGCRTCRSGNRVETAPAKPRLMSCHLWTRPGGRVAPKDLEGPVSSHLMSMSNDFSGSSVARKQTSACMPSHGALASARLRDQRCAPRTHWTPYRMSAQSPSRRRPHPLKEVP